MPEADHAPARVLAVLHQHNSTTGRIGRLLEEAGYLVDVRRPRFGDPLPHTLCDYAGAMIFGGPMSANDNEDWIRREIEWIGVPLAENKPFLGICLGAQMLARHLGQRVRPHPQGRVEVGYYPITPTEHGHSVCERRFPAHVYQWHQEGFEAPRGALLLARGGDFETQAIRYGCAYGLQFHPEVTLPMICRWTARGREKIASAEGARPLHRHFEGWLRHDRAVARWSAAFLRRWLAGERSCPDAHARAHAAAL